MGAKESSPLQLALEIGRAAWEEQMKSIEDYEKMQQKLLTEILQSNAHTEYGLLYQFSMIDREDVYKERVPLSTYRVYKPFIQKLLRVGCAKEGSMDCQNGKPDIPPLLHEQLTGWAITSATSGNVKYIPQTKSMADFFIKDFIFRGMALADERYYKISGKHLDGGRILLLMGGSVEYENEEKSSEKENGSAPVTSISTAAILNTDRELYPLSAIPVELLADRRQKVKDMLYLYLRFALVCEDIIYVASIYDDYVMTILSYLNQNWKSLCDEIEQGIYNENALAFHSEDVKNYKEYLQPNPGRAEKLRGIFEDASLGEDDFTKDDLDGAANHTVLQKDTLHRIWPHLQVVSAAGKIGNFLSDQGLERYLEGIGYDSSPYGATESMMGVAIELDDPRMMLLPHTCYYEFISEDKMSEDNPKTMTMAELKEGALYELVITTKGGFYRYRLGDLLRVVGRKMDCPLFCFEGRKGIGMDLASEKASEDVLRNALIVAAVQCRIPLSGYCMYGEGDRVSLNGASTLRYVVQFETKKELTSEEVEAFSKEIDRQIGCVVKSYKSLRSAGNILPLRVVQLPAGTFAAFDERKRTVSSIPAQYKRPFIMKLSWE